MGTENDQKLSIEIFKGQPIKTTEEVKFLGITIDSKLKVQKNVEDICKREATATAGYL